MLRYARVLVAVLSLCAAPVLRAQQATGLDLGGGLTAGGEAERYLRALQLLGVVPQYPVALRPWNRHELQRLSPTADHLWKMRFGERDSSGSLAHLTVLRPQLRLTLNSALPEGDDPIWFGSGATVDGAAGLRFTWGVLDVQIAPSVSWAQNQAFALAPNGMTGDGSLRDARFPGNIDAPQRFGTSGYARIVPGESRISVDTRYATVGFSTARLAWGPAQFEPLVVGPNAGGFPHLYLGSGEPLQLGVGRLHARWIVGRLEQSEWSPVQSGNRSRLAAAVIGTFQPRGIRGLEVGAIRFQHEIWMPGVATMKMALRPLTGFFNDASNKVNIAGENGYASFFFRWAAAPKGFEVYGEYGKEDWAGNTRWFLQKPDDLGNLLLGVQRAHRTAAGVLRVLRAEIINGELSSNERGQRGLILLPPYIHGEVLQGHTVNGRILGSVTAYGGAGWRLVSDNYTPRGRRSIVLERRLLLDASSFAVDAGRSAPEVRYGAHVNWMRFGSTRRSYGVSAGASYTLNWNTVKGRDALNLQAGLSWSGW